VILIISECSGVQSPEYVAMLRLLFRLMLRGHVTIIYAISEPTHRGRKQVLLYL
jgi:hypothetical protein